MFGPEIVVRSISARSKKDKFGNSWQYNSRGDHHSQVPCWAVLFDALLTSQRLRQHAENGQVVFGINHQMFDFKNNRSKKLDLVVCTPAAGWDKKRKPLSFHGLVKKHGIREPRHLRIRMVEEIRWMQKYVRGEDWSPPVRAPAPEK